MYEVVSESAGLPAESRLQTEDRALAFALARKLNAEARERGQRVVKTVGSGLFCWEHRPTSLEEGHAEKLVRVTIKRTE